MTTKLDSPAFPATASFSFPLLHLDAKSIWSSRYNLFDGNHPVTAWLIVGLIVETAFATA
jgi:hypothetical protein